MKLKMQKWEVIAWIILIVWIIIDIFGQAKLQRCYDATDNCGEDWNWEPREGDKPVDLLQRLQYAFDAQNTIIQRKIAMISSFLITLAIFLYFKHEIPRFSEFALLFVIIVALIWFLLRYHESHMLYPISFNGNKSVNELRYQLGISKRPFV